MRIYRVNRWSDNIEVLDVDHETKSYYFFISKHGLRPVRVRKQQLDAKFFLSWLDANNYCINRAYNRIEYLERELRKTESRLGELKGRT